MPIALFRNHAIGLHVTEERPVPVIGQWPATKSPEKLRIPRPPLPLRSHTDQEPPGFKSHPDSRASRTFSIDPSPPHTKNHPVPPNLPPNPHSTSTLPHWMSDCLEAVQWYENSFRFEGCSFSREDGVLTGMETSIEALPRWLRVVYKVAVRWRQ